MTNIHSGNSYQAIFAAACLVAVFGAPAAFAQTANPPLSITPISLPPATVNLFYSQTFAASTGSQGPFFWRIMSGTLPPGLSFDASATGSVTTISGTPSAAGSYTFTVSVTDRVNAATQTYTMNVNGTTPTSTPPTPPPAPVSGNTTSTVALQREIAELQNELRDLGLALRSVTPRAPNTGTGAVFTRNLAAGDTGSDVRALQEFLNTTGNSMVATTGPGSPGNETDFFGPRTAQALSAWQAKNGIVPAQGFFGPVTRARIRALVE